MRNLLTVLVVVALLASGVTAGEPDKDLHNKCIYPTVMIQGTNQLYGGNGTGVIVKSMKKGEKWANYVFTCAHILQQTPPRIVVPSPTEDKKPTFVPPKYEYKVRVGNYKDWSHLTSIDDYDCEVLIRNVGHWKDTALVRFWSDKEMPAAELYTDPKLYIGNEVIRVGCGLEEPFRVDYGRITSMPKSIADRLSFINKHTYRISAPTVPGDSGAPVYEGYKVFGLAQLIRSFNDKGLNLPVFHMVYVIPIERFTEDKVINDCLDGKDPPQSMIDLIHKADEAQSLMEEVPPHPPEIISESEEVEEDVAPVPPPETEEAPPAPE